MQSNSTNPDLRWVILGPAERKGFVLVRCTCPAATEKEVWGYDIEYGKSLSCGCLRREMMTTHGTGRSNLAYPSWNTMIQRCTNPNAPGYENYGGRGIKVCDRWRGVEGFVNFLADVGERESKEYTIDRYPDMNGNYEPGNCRWATKKEQARNMRGNVNLTYNGKTQCLSAWAEELGIDRMVLEGRVRRGWDDVKVLTTVVETRRPKNAKGASVITHNGKTQRISAWSKELGIPVSVIYDRLWKGQKPEEILAPYQRKNRAGLTYNGKTQSIKAWAAETGIPLPTIKSRLDRNWPVEQVLGGYQHKRDLIDTPPPARYDTDSTG